MRSPYNVALAIAFAVVGCGPGPRPDNGLGDDTPADAPPRPPADTPPAVDAPPAQPAVYAHTATTLYRVDPTTLIVTLVGNFTWPNVPDQMTDIAIDKNGRFIGVSFTKVYTIDPATAGCTLLSSSLDGTFNGLSFVPAASVGETGEDVLVGTRNSDGMVFRVDPMTGTTSPVGNMGATFTSSGDLVAVDGFGIVQTTPGTTDVLVQLAPQTFVATPIGTGTGFTSIWGVAYWGDKIFGFTSLGQFITIDPLTGVGTLINGNGPAWWGAAVTTSAPIL